MVIRQNSLIAFVALLSFSALASADSVYVTAFNLVTGNQEFGTVDLVPGPFTKFATRRTRISGVWFQLRMDLC